jgi:hypothetical protein
MSGPAAPFHALANTRAVRSAVNAAFHAYARRRTRALTTMDPVAVQERTLHALLRRARATRFGRDHGFDAIGSVADYQRAVPLRTYEQLWDAYLREAYPVLEDVTWPGRMPYFALTSGTTQGATKYIPISREMIGSNLKASRTMVAYDLAAHPRSRLFEGRMFFLGGTTALERPAPGVAQGDLSGIASLRAGEWLRPFTFPPLELALESDWDRKLSLLAERSRDLPITLVGGVPSWLLMLFQRLLDLTGRRTVADVWPRLEVVVHGGVKFDPYEASFRAVLGNPAIRLQESYPCSEGFIAFGDPATGLLRLLFDHGLFFEFVPVDELGSDRPARHWLGTVEPGVNYAVVVTTCAGLWGHVVGDTVRFEQLDPPLLRFTGRTKYTLSAFGEHLISEEVEAAMAEAAAATGAAVQDWHVGPVFRGALGFHQYVVEFRTPPGDLGRFRADLDAALCHRNADYQAHRADGVGLPPPALLVALPGGFAAWMRARGKLGGQHKVPRMDNTGTLTADLVAALQAAGHAGARLAADHGPDRPDSP